MIKNYILSILGLFLLILQPTEAQVANKSALTIEQIMQGEQFVGVSPSNVFWAEDGQTIYFDWNPEQLPYKELYKISLGSSKPEKVSITEQLALPNKNGVYNQDQTQKVYSLHGDIYLHTIDSKKTLQITNTIQNEYQPSFSTDGQYIFFRSANNMYRWQLATGSLWQLSDFKKGSAPQKKTIPKAEQWLKDDQNILEVLQDRATNKKLQEAYYKAFEAKRPKSIYLEGWSINDLCISPDGQYIVYGLKKNDSPAKSTAVPDYVTDNGFTKNLSARAKVGHTKAEYKTGIYNIAKDSFYAVETTTIPGIYDKPQFLADYHAKEDGAFKKKYEVERTVLLHRPVFSDNSEAVTIVRALDCKDRWIMRLDLETGKLKLLDRQHDEAWIGGPGISMWTSWGGLSGWLKDDLHYWFLSEESGYAHLYTVNVQTGEKQAITQGNWEVTDVKVSKDIEHFYITTSEIDPGERHFYKILTKGGKAEQISTLAGNHKVFLSPNEENLAVLYSSSNQPWELYTMSNQAQAAVQQITHSQTTAFKSYNWREPELVYFKARDGKKVRARLYTPQKKKKNGAAVIFVHGAGYLQNVHKWWSLYYREYMFHNLLADNGYTVLDIDYRASEGYGRDWRTAIYRHMGGQDLEDQIDGASFLTKEHKIDAQRIGIYGGSYGGFITLMAMFKSPETFKCGAALRSVTDWAHYNHSYTSCILNSPVEDSLAYQRSSPIYHAAGLKGKLLMLHGMTDTNVQFQDVVRLSQRLIELGKDNWELAIFPMEGHGFVEPSSWTDEYKRIFKLFQENLSKK